MVLATYKADGKINKYLCTNSPDGVTFWQHKVKKHICFAMDSVEQPFTTSASFGKQASLTLQRQGDLVFSMFLRVQLPGLAACDGSSSVDCPQIASGNRFPISDCASAVTSDDSFFSAKIPGFDGMSKDEQAAALKTERDAWRRKNYGAAAELGCCVDEEDGCPTDMCEDLDGMWAHWVNGVGHALIDTAVFKVGGVVLDTITGLQMYCWEEMSGKSGRRLQEMTGRRYTLGQLFCDSREKRDLYIPLPFFFTHSTANSLKTVAMYYHAMTVDITFTALEKLIVVSNERVSVRNAEMGYPITAQDLSASIETTAVLVHDVEEAALKENKIDELIIQHQSLTTNLRGMSRLPITFTSAISSMFVVVRRLSNIASNDWTNFSGIDKRDPIKSMDLKFNSTSYLTGKKPAVFYRTVVPYQFFSNIPECFIYAISFAIEPEGTKESSGFINFSKLDNIELDIQLQDALESSNVEITVMARGWNVFSIEKGAAKLMFS